jgi:hypothetical protein
VRAVEEKCMDKEGHDIYSPIKKWNCKEWEDNGIVSSKIWSNVFGWFKAYYAIWVLKSDCEPKDNTKIITALKEEFEANNNKPERTDNWFELTVSISNRKYIHVIHTNKYLDS